MHRSGTASPAPRHRLILVLVGACLIPVGLVARFLVGGWAGDAAGGVLYAVLVYLLVAFISPTWRPAVVAVTALGFCWAVELLQLTPLPHDLGSVFPPARLVLGTTFVAGDLIAYAAGAVAACLADRYLSRLRTAPKPAAVGDTR